MKRLGRPKKYMPFLQILDDEVLYSPATIVSAGEKAGLFKAGNGIFEKDLDEAELKAAKVLIRHTLSALQRKHAFPKTGDGMVLIRSQAPLPGWYGKRWKATIC